MLFAGHNQFSYLWSYAFLSYLWAADSSAWSSKPVTRIYFERGHRASSGIFTCGESKAENNMVWKWPESTCEGMQSAGKHSSSNDGPAVIDSALVKVGGTQAPTIAMPTNLYITSNCEFRASSKAVYLFLQNGCVSLATRAPRQ
jgi:hypothetical protein